MLLTVSAAFGTGSLLTLFLFGDIGNVTPSIVQLQDTPSSEEKSKHSLLCTTNPYKDALTESLSVVAQRSEAWLSNVTKHREKASMKLYSQRMSPPHEQFFAFEKMATCHTNNTMCVGGECGQDESKIVCGLNKLLPPCVIYSIGGNNQWKFELDLLSKTPCEIHTFDCTGPRERFHKPRDDRLFFHHVCLGTTVKSAPESCTDRNICGEIWTIDKIQKELGHKKIDLLKMDIEGYEWPIFESWQELTTANEANNRDANATELPMQILVEFHYYTVFQDLLKMYNVSLAEKGANFRHATDVVSLQEHLLKIGYIIVVRDDNPFCPHCTELTLVRAKCAPRTPTPP